MAKDPFSPKKRFSIGRVVTGLVVIFSVTFVVAYYVPLTAAHSALAKEHESLSGSQQSVSTQLKLTTTQLEAAQKERDGLHKQLTDIKNAQEAAQGKAKELSERIAEQLARRTKRKQVTVSQSGLKTSVLIDDIRLYRGHQATVHRPGRAILCDVGKAAKADGLTLEVVSHASTDAVNPALAGDYPTTWELTSARAASAVRALASCGVKPAAAQSMGVGHHRPIQGAAKNSTGQLEILISELSTEE